MYFAHIKVERCSPSTPYSYSCMPLNRSAPIQFVNRSGTYKYTFPQYYSCHRLFAYVQQNYDYISILGFCMHRSIYTCTFKYNFKNLLYSFQPFKNRTTFMKTAYKTRKVMNIDFVCARSLRSCCSTEMLLSHNTDFSRHYRVNESR